MGITSVESFAISGRMGYPILINPSRVFTLAELKPAIQEYRDAWKEAGHKAPPQAAKPVGQYNA